VGIAERSLLPVWLLPVLLLPVSLLQVSWIFFQARCLFCGFGPGEDNVAIAPVIR
jgi:hypothetical protein